jgi:hypothetical protein
LALLLLLLLLLLLALFLLHFVLQMRMGAPATLAPLLTTLSVLMLRLLKLATPAIASRATSRRMACV